MKLGVLAALLVVCMGCASLQTKLTETPGGVVKVSGDALVSIDRAWHWLDDRLHSKVLHPAVRVLTLGVVDFDATDEAPAE